MRGLSPALVVMLAGVALFVGAVVAWGDGPPARGGRAIPVTTKAPHQPGLVRGGIARIPAGEPFAPPAPS